MGERFVRFWFEDDGFVFDDANCSGFVGHSSDHFVNDLFGSFGHHDGYYGLDLRMSKGKKVFDIL